LDDFDFEAWLDRTRAEVGEWNEISLKVTDPGDRQIAYSTLLCAIALQLKRLPGMREHATALDAFWLAYRGLADGKGNPLFENHAGTIGGRTLTHAEEWLQTRAVASVELLMEAGVSELNAINLVAKSLTDAGMKGSRRKGPITGSTVRTWRSKTRSGDAPEMRKNVDESVLRIREMLGCRDEMRAGRSQVTFIVSQLLSHPTIKSIAEVNFR
jgi:uncharacterized protein YoaH (UPF0181 family)